MVCGQALVSLLREVARAARHLMHPALSEVTPLSPSRHRKRLSDLTMRLPCATGTVGAAQEMLAAAPYSFSCDPSDRLPPRGSTAIRRGDELRAREALPRWLRVPSASSWSARWRRCSRS